MFYDCLHVLRSITVEPVLFAFMFGTFLKFPVTQQLIFQKTCIQKFNETFCRNNFTRGTCVEKTKYQDVVASESSQWIFYQTIALCIPSLVSSLFLGSWSDKFGRKVVIVLPLIGGCFEAISTIINIHFFAASPVYLLLGNIVCGIFGGFSTILMILFAYIADITKDKTKRTLRIGILESMTFLGATFGELISGVIIEQLGFMAPFIITLLLHLLTIIYVLVVLRESYFPPEENKSRSLFSFDNFKDGIQVYIKPRPQNQRLYLILALTIGLCIPLIVFSGTNDVIVLFVLNHPFCFTPSVIGYFLAVSFIVKSVGVLIGLSVMRKLLKLPDSIIAFSGILTNIASAVFLAFTTNTWQAFLAISTGIFNGLTLPSMRAMMSKMVDCNEQGSLFAVVACVEILSTLVASLISNNIYKATISTLPGLSFLIMAVMLLFPLILMIFFYRQQRTINHSLEINDEDNLVNSEEMET